MARRGPELRNHILWAAKNVFIEAGFERTSMDAVAARAETSKRSLYAFFETKDKLFVAVVDLVRGLYLDSIKTPEHYADQPIEAVTLFCGRFLQMLTWESVLRICRLGITEVDRLPEASGLYYETVFGDTQERLGAYIQEHFAVPDGAALARELIGQTVYPVFVRALFGVGKLLTDLPDEASIGTDLDLTPIRETVVRLLASGSSRS